MRFLVGVLLQLDQRHSLSIFRTELVLFRTAAVPGGLLQELWILAENREFLHSISLERCLDGVPTDIAQAPDGAKVYRVLNE
jgi:hypothetical protein